MSIHKCAYSYLCSCGCTYAVCLLSLRCAADDPAIQSFLLQKSQLFDFVSKLGCKECGSDVVCTKTKFEYTAGQFQFCCSNKKCRKQIDFDTQILCGSHYTLNQALISGHHVNTGNLTSLNNTMKCIRASTIAESYYQEITGVCNLTILQQALEETTASLERFKAQSIRDCEADATFTTQGGRGAGKGSPCAMFGVINQENNEVIHADAQYIRDTASKNAWCFEKNANEAWFEVLKKELIELDNWVHDACAKLSAAVPAHIAHFRDLHESSILLAEIAGEPVENPEPFKPRTRDCHDTWHGKRSYLKLWVAFIQLFSKAVKRGNSTTGAKKESKDVIRNKTIASRQLKAITSRVNSASMQVTGSVHAEKDLTHEEKEYRVMQLLAEVLMKCCIHDDHTLCKQTGGESTACVLEQGLSSDFDTSTDCQKAMRALPTQAALMFTTCGHKCNLYTLEQGLDDELNDIETECCEVVDAEDTVEDEEALDEILEELDFMQDIDEMADDTDPLQPKSSVLTHPIAIDCMMAFLNSTKLDTLMKKHINCKSTSMIESFNAVVHKYAPKRFHFDKTYKARVGMATLDWNETQRNRTVRESKSGNRYVSHRDKTYHWQQEMLARMGNYLRW